MYGHKLIYVIEEEEKMDMYEYMYPRVMVKCMKNHPCMDQRKIHISCPPRISSSCVHKFRYFYRENRVCYKVE